MLHIVQKPPTKSPSGILFRVPTFLLQLLHLSRILLLNTLDRLVPVELHHTLFLEVFHLVDTKNLESAICRRIDIT